VTGVAFSPDSALVAFSSVSGTTRVIDTSTGDQRAVLKGFFNAATSVGFSPDGRRLAVGSGGDGDIKIYDVVTWKELITLTPEYSLRGPAQDLSDLWVAAVNFSSDGSCLRARNGFSGGGYVVRYWRVKTAEEIAAAEAKEKVESPQP
jgi:WD40 repeat protein